MPVYRTCLLSTLRTVECEAAAPVPRPPTVLAAGNAEGEKSDQPNPSLVKARRRIQELEAVSDPPAHSTLHTCHVSTRVVLICTLRFQEKAEISRKIRICEEQRERLLKSARIVSGCATGLLCILTRLLAIARRPSRTRPQMWNMSGGNEYSVHVSFASCLSQSFQCLS